jgi:hypothetical protein
VARQDEASTAAYAITWSTTVSAERHPTDPHRDLDLASYGVVAVLEPERGTTYPDMAWEPNRSSVRSPPPTPAPGDDSGQATTCPAGIIRTAAYDVNVPFMQLERRGWDIHAV